MIINLDDFENGDELIIKVGEPKYLVNHNNGKFSTFKSFNTGEEQLLNEYFDLKRIANEVKELSRALLELEIEHIGLLEVLNK